MKKRLAILLLVGFTGALCAAERVTFGGDFRMRILHEDARKLNDTEAGDDRLWQRYRARVWTSVEATERMQFNLRLVTEPRHYSHFDPATDWIREETLFDRFNVSFDEVFSLPLKLTLGRQGIEFADRWLVGEGTPEDGTRSDHFDAVRAQWTFVEQRMTADLIWIEQRRASDAWLPPIHDTDLDNRKQDERGLIAWLSKEVRDDRFLDSYFIYKHDFNGDGTSDSVNGESYTFGLRAHGRIDDRLSYNADLAPQFGQKNGKDYSAFAANSWLQWNWPEAKQASLRFGYEYLSGDSDPDKSFDKLWGREGLWSDLYTGGVDGFDGRTLDSSNLHRPHVIAGFHPSQTLTAKAEYSLLFADETVDEVDSSRVDNGSKFRGHHVKASLEQQLASNVKHYVTMQAMLPGSYYSDSREDTATWFRYGIEYTF